MFISSSRHPAQLEAEFYLKSMDDHKTTECLCCPWALVHGAEFIVYFKSTVYFICLSSSVCHISLLLYGIFLSERLNPTQNTFKISPHSHPILYETSISDVHSVLVHFHSGWWHANGIFYYPSRNAQENVTFKRLILQCAGCHDLRSWCCPSGWRLRLSGEMWCQRSDAPGWWRKRIL